MAGPAVLTTVDQLVHDRAEGRPVRILDVRWSLARPDGRDAYRAGHVPGAVYVDLETQLSRRPRPGEGRHPLPYEVDLQAAARSWGIDDGDAVVVYDDSGNPAALRDRFAGLGLDRSVPVGVCCGSGVTAAHEAVALTVAGYRPVLYAGSWSEWSSHPDRPVATG